MKHGIEHVGDPPLSDAGKAPLSWAQLQTALGDLELWGLLTLGAILLISSGI